MPFDLDCRDADYRRDPDRPKKCEQSGELDEGPVRLVGPEREAFLGALDNRGVHSAPR